MYYLALVWNHFIGDDLWSRKGPLVDLHVFETINTAMYYLYFFEGLPEKCDANIIIHILLTTILTTLGGSDPDLNEKITLLKAFNADDIGKLCTLWERHVSGSSFYTFRSSTTVGMVLMTGVGMLVFFLGFCWQRHPRFEPIEPRECTSLSDLTTKENAFLNSCAKYDKLPNRKSKDRETRAIQKELRWKIHDYRQSAYGALTAQCITIDEFRHHYRITKERTTQLFEDTGFDGIEL